MNEATPANNGHKQVTIVAKQPSKLHTLLREKLGLDKDASVLDVQGAMAALVKDVASATQRPADEIMAAVNARTMAMLTGIKEAHAAHAEAAAALAKAQTQATLTQEAAAARLAALLGD